MPAAKAPAKPAMTSRDARRGAGTRGAGAEAIGVGAPLDLEGTPASIQGGRIARVGVTKQVGGAALPVAPAPHRLDEQQAIEPLFRRSLVIDDGRVDLEHHRAAAPRREHALTAEVVIPLHDDVRREAISRDGAATQRAASRAGRRGKACHVTGCRARPESQTARRRSDMHVMAAGQPFGDRPYVIEPPVGAGNRLIGREVQDSRITIERSDDSSRTRLTFF